MKASSPQISSWVVQGDQQGMRLDSFVRRCLPHLSLRQAQKAIGEGAFRVNRRRGKKGDRLQAGDAVEFDGAPEWLAATPLPGGDLNVIVRYEDESVLVLDKPAEIATHGFSGRETNSLANFLSARYPALHGVGRSRWQPGLANRLDQGTSGLVLAARDRAAFDDLRSQFRRGLVKKKYWALVWGRAPKQGVLDLPLAHDPGDRRKMRVASAPRGRAAKAKIWPALTRFRLAGHAEEFSLLEVEIGTGVTHQIRVHLQAAGHPIVGDPLYGREPNPVEASGPRGFTGPLGLRRQFLHAFFLDFRHPRDGREIVVESPLPEDLNEVTERLGLQF
ncbi:MAG: hypothetical protein A3F90_03980 [Deltaproteobacteria bacterium RIFCSPLOWO2_12_FULL_60_19]|nr:MAG: hypothetical protein A3F90_03980 [Deltaproteobacteria bacterium RIFCSPLOWO2_12_FULL_60_19]